MSVMDSSSTQTIDTPLGSSPVRATSHSSRLHGQEVV